MREILFRGKDPETGKWYEGFYMALSDTTYCFEEDYAAHPDNTKHYIVFDEMTDWCLPNRHLRADVDPSTVGQYTGLKDKNGKRIFEGDVAKVLQGKDKDIAYVGFENGAFMLYPKTGNIYERTLWEYWYNDWDVEVIGNITDNHELLEK